jgi:two-component system chemotaxis sensor kinase CheA
MAAAMHDDIQEFLKEANHYMEEIEPILVGFKDLPASGNVDVTDLIGRVFRAFHSIKGHASFLSFFRIQHVTHKAENLLDQVRSGNLELGGGMLEALLAACDFLQARLDEVGKTGAEGGGDDEQAAMEARLSEYLPKAAGGRAAVRSDMAVAEGQDLMFDFLKAPEFITSLFSAFSDAAESAEMKLLDTMNRPSDTEALLSVSRLFQAVQFNAATFGHPLAANLAGSMADCLSLLAARKRPPEQSFYAQCFDGAQALKDWVAKPEGAAALPEKAAAWTSLLASLQAVPQASDAPGNTSVTVAPLAAKEQARPAAPAEAGAKRPEIRVSLEKLDKLVDLIEELGVVAGGLANFSSRGLVKDRDVSHSIAKLRFVSGSLQEVAMSVRLVPLSTTFRKMIRLVHDVSNKLGKPTKLEIIGEETEVEKDAVELLADPLVHIFRNAMDHGLEDPETRKAAGKPATGKLTLQAWHAGGEVCISISDDGKGLPRDKVLAKAMAKGLVPEGADLKDEDVYALIFAPGFSTAEAVTEYSGRGVGMDVAKKNIDKLNGRIDISSKPGQGTTFTVVIPMKNALTESMLLRVGQLRYSIRITSVRESLCPRAEDISVTPEGIECLLLRGHLYPVARLHQLHGIEGGKRELHEGVLVVVESKGQKQALFADEILGRVQGVVKPLPPAFPGLPGISGCSIIGMGSDDVCWALDVNGLRPTLRPRLRAVAAAA